MKNDYLFLTALFFSFGEIRLPAAEPAKVIPPSQANASYGPHPRNVLDLW